MSELAKSMDITITGQSSTCKALIEGLPLAVAMMRPPAGMSSIVEKKRAKLKSRDVHLVCAQKTSKA